MADKDLGKRTFESLAKASLSVRYTRLVNGQNGARADPGSPVSLAADAASVNSGSSRPQLRTVVEPCPPVRMKGLLGLYQDRIRTLQSPSWLLEEQRQLHRKNGPYPAGERLIAAGNSLLDVCRFLEILLNDIRHEASTSATDETSGAVIDESGQTLGENLAAIWSDLYLAVKHLRTDCRRSGALVRHAAVELLNISVDLEDGQSYPDIWRQKFGSRLELLSAGIADAYQLMPRTPTPFKEKSKSIKNVLSQNASILKRSGAEKRVAVFSEPAYTNVELAREIGVIGNAVNDLAKKLNNSNVDHAATIGMLKLCAARLKSILLLSYSLKRWELDLHRAHYIFRQAARQLSIAQETAGQGTAMSPASLPYERMADYICDRFEDTMALILIKTDSGYARHNFTVKKKSGRIPSQGVLRSPVNSPVRKNMAVRQTIQQPSLRPVDKRPGGNLRYQTTETLGSVAFSAIHSAPSNISVDFKLANPDTSSKADKGGPKNDVTEGATGSGTIRQKRLTQQVVARRQSGARAATMGMYWQEIQKLSEQQRSDKSYV
jgi:hypothetical protein